MARTADPTSTMLPWISELPLNMHDVVIFTLVLTRVSGLMLTAPIYGSNEVPPQVRVFLAFALAMLIAPTQLAAPTPMPQTMVQMLLFVGGELLIGVVLGLGVMVLFAGVQLAGQIIGQLSGMALADVFNPGMDSSVPLFSHLLYLFTLAIYVIMGGHRLLMAGLLSTFVAMPPGTSQGLSEETVDAVVTLLVESFALGIRAAAPATVALLLATLVLGLISRTLPQLNVMAIGFGINAAATMLCMAASLGAIAWLFQESLEPHLALLFDGMGLSTGSP